MSTTSEFLLPDPGEGLTEAEIVSWRVKPGDTVSINQVLVEIETAKSLVELPSPFEGVVRELLVAEGDTVDVGSPIIRVITEGDGGQADAPAPVDETVRDELADAAGSVTTEPEDKPGAVLVGYGVKAGAAQTRRNQRRTRRLTAVPAASATSVIAKPPIRKLAKDLGVDLTEVAGSGLVGEITRDDVIRHAQQASVFRNIETPEWGADREEYIPVKGVRKAIATGMVRSAFSAPHVGVFVDVDATRTMEFVARLKASADFAGIKVSPMLIMAKAMIWAVRRNPTVNSTWTDEQIIVHNYVNFGFAAATPRGLVVPNVKDAQELSLRELAQALEHMTNVAREGRLQPADMANGTITVTNIGVFGMDTGTPILNPGEVAIVALGTIKQKPWVVDGEVRPRFVTTLGASFDHRVVDGDVASRFLADVASIIEEPALLLD
ncbi:dihydrolipoamide acetyltransferase family protein [Cryobacterium sp. BB736]|uniref:dihydrolipoamide acetyltransferase family protein n=1 Tax=Cryobacterium sp. BB736 TaxID=2746963 RepID=UPI00187704C8|nr:dihydrolipoamide acetyltransferase family protein [Cryobacterium sp. BB736]